MSERGSFVTEYCYCAKCFDVLKRHLLAKRKYLCSTQIPSWCDQELPIIAGKVGGSSTGEEAITFEFDIIPKIEKEICHEVTIAVIPDNKKSAEIFTVKPIAECVNAN